MKTMEEIIDEKYSNLSPSPNPSPSPSPSPAEIKKNFQKYVDQDITLVPYYFQHKIADEWSTFMNIYRCGKLSDKCEKKIYIPFIKNCFVPTPQPKYDDLGNSETDCTCSLAFYKNRSFIPLS